MRKPADRAQVEAELQRVVELRHPEPHSVLGVHPDGDGMVVRAYRPEAVSIHVLPEFGGKVPMVHRTGGVFEARINGRTEPFSYLLEVEYPGKKVFTLRDPYSFLPTLGELDLYFAGEGRHERLWERMGAHLIHHNGVKGTSFAVWAPTAASVSVVGDFNGWDGRLHSMRRMGSSGIWELFVPEVGEGTRYKFEIRPGHGGGRLLKSDPFAFRTETPPATASVVHDLARYSWGDTAWLEAREKHTDAARQPWSVYEVHLGSWRRVVEDGDRPMTYRELAPELSRYVKELGFTHVELLPVAEHPYGGSWGYQVGGYYAPTSRFGHPDDFRYLVDYLHQEGVGIIVDWVPGHFPRDSHALGDFDGTSLYEHADPRKGAQPDWGTLVFNFGRNEVRNFLIANALFWLEEYHIDGLRVDAVASMLYLDYSRKHGEWIPNRWGGRENEEAIQFLRELNDTIRRKHPGVVVIAEESTAWPKVSQPTSEGGLGFHFKWNMGWMHDTLSYFGKDPIHRQYHHNQLTFGLLYAFSEHFMLPLSHDEVVHGKGSLYGRMPGDPWQKRANLRALFAWMWAHPGKKLLFMGGEFGQPGEWNHDKSLDWHLLDDAGHKGIQKLVGDLNRVYRELPALHDADSEPVGFQWLQPDASAANVLAFVRRSRTPGRHVVCVANLSPVPRENYRVGFPLHGRYVELVNSDAGEYGGSGLGNNGQVHTEPTGWDGQPASVALTLPPLSVVWFTPG
ncbi:1,4-alpha-glucan branching protein GlgB [Corallococcus praedator]|uniref:1,4-alpha-glucan branching enzyme GlgB n=1 Tax=Corallococcus praedator TaxID=2316724 RepID=A0ABX9QPG6_9BACT|nr:MULTISPECIES: 1,4-alpha-glucan branching protein GlgB [Corallococcus]RKH16613.1 1,4-alpha-glucan branching protein GlgB [Corallococcus sp. CA047B]RKH34430.1 1,4-alpha-glucan branching protein GlgB [Corallococcus sp. CA031C]RKI15517.1 1,4-alpha-glucan branching protein GlgB [Corallococcus praedator]